MLTGKQERFCQCIADGMTQADAYRAAYPTTKQSTKTMQENASRMMSDSKILARVTELRDALTKELVWTRLGTATWWRNTTR